MQFSLLFYHKRYEIYTCMYIFQYTILCLLSVCGIRFRLLLGEQHSEL